MDVSKLKDLFKNSFTGNFEGGKQFSYSHCIVDLNPNLAEYNSEVPDDLINEKGFMLDDT